VNQRRKYIKRSEYWKQFGNTDKPIQDILKHSHASGTEPESTGDPFYTQTSIAARNEHYGSDISGRRRNAITLNNKLNRFHNIRAGMLPYDYSSDGVNVRESIELCQKAYANVAIFRNAIDIMAEFSNSNIYLEGGNDKSKKFINKWLDKINIWKLKDQYFREYYRSGNIFLYRLDGKFNSEDFAKLNYIYAADSLKPGTIPVRYVLLNPYDIVSDKATAFKDGVYKKVLSDYELEKLRTPKTEEDRQIFDSLPKETRKKIKDGSFTSEGIEMEIDPERLAYSFYKKQDYEPFAIPFGFPVLEDINWKLELKKIDQAIARTVENVILLITMGNEPEKGGINPKNLQAMQSLFKNESVGRVLVADYTTEANFIIPDIAKIIGSEKYKIVNEDIREGLQNVIVGNEKFSNTQIKAEIFLERLKESRNAFLNDFLQPQIKMVCRNMGFRNYPEAKFEEIDIKDEVQFQRVITRLLEIGILTPEQGIKSMETGLYPNSKELSSSQQQYIKDREKGMYNPLVGGIPLVESAESQENRKIQEEQLDIQRKAAEQNIKSQKVQDKKPDVNKTPKSAGRPNGTTGIPATASDLYDRGSIQDTIYKIESFQKDAVITFKESKNLKEINKDQEGLISKLCESIICSSEKTWWARRLKSCIKNIDNIGKLETLGGVLGIASEHELETYPSAILYHSKRKINK
jgi:hypothetical protein